MIKYLRSNIVFQEIPSEISLAFEITNCPYRCKGCHSPELQEDIGIELTPELIQHEIRKHFIFGKAIISCVLFLGGDQFGNDFIELIKTVKEFNLKAALYTGSCDIDETLKKHLNYLKIGTYDETKGNLKSESTNQVLYKLESGKLEVIKFL